MKPFCRLRVTGALFCLLLAAPRLFGNEVVDRILIHVNSRIISQSLFEARFEQASRETGPPADATRREEMKKSVMEELVNESLLEDRARDLDLITSDQEIEDQIKKLKEQNNVTSDEEFVRALAANGLTVERLRDQLRKSLTVQRVVGREVNSKVDLSDDALRGIYEREKDTWKVPEKAHLAEILIPRGDSAATRERAERHAKEASDLLKAGTKFEAVVAQYSEGATKSRGGDLGIVARGELNPEIDRAVFSLPVGGVTDPVTSRFGWHIVKLIERMPASYKPFSEVKADLLKREQETQFQKKLAEYLQKLKQEAVIKVAPEAQPYYTPPPAAAREFPEAVSVSTSASPGAAPSGGGSGRGRGVEIVPMAGFRFGGTTSSYGNTYIERVGIPDTLSWGATVEVPVSDHWSAEVLWSHQDTELRADLSGLEAPGGVTDRKLTHLNVDTFQIGPMVQSGSSDQNARLYLELLFGASVLTPAPGFSTRTRFSLSIGGGVKYYFGDHVGALFGARWMPVYLNSSSSGYGYCSPYYGCYSYYNTNFLSQGDAHFGLITKF